VVSAAGGDLAVGRTLGGRGAWLCADSPGCAELAGRRKAWGRALRAEVGPAAVAALPAKLAGHGSIEGSNIEPGSSRGTHRRTAGEET